MPRPELVRERPEEPGRGARREGVAEDRDAPEGLEGMEARLRLHPGRRLEIVKELAADLEALEEELVARGIRRGEARRAAVRRLLPDAEVISALEATHRPEGLRAAPVQWLRRWERAVALVLTLGLVIWLALSAAAGGMIRTANPFVWVELGLLALMIANWAVAGAKLLLGEDLRRDERRRRGRRQAGLIVAAFAVAALGAALETYALIGGAAAAPPAMAEIWSAVGRITSTAAFALAAPVVGLLAWLTLTPRLIRYERIEARIRRLFRARGPRLEEEGQGERR